MSHEKPTEEIRELAALFSLGVLTQHEARSFETHMREGCQVCKKEYDKFKHITAEIGLNVNETAPPEYIREMILAGIERESSGKAAENKPEPETENAAVQTPPAPAPRLFQNQSAGRRPGILPRILAVLFAAVGALAFYTYHTERIIKDRLELDLNTARSNIKDLNKFLEDQKNRQGELEQIISAVSKPETRILHLAGYDKAPSASGAILWDVQENKCLIFGHMPPVPTGKAYQLWYLTSAERIPSGMLKPDPTGRVYSWFPIPESVTSVTMVITLEPEGGSDIPSLPYYAIGRKD